MRTITELYDILIKYVSNGEYHWICTVIINKLDITKEESELLLEHFIKNKPTSTLHREFYNSKYFCKYSSMTWWTGGMDEKIKFLTYLRNESIKRNETTKTINIWNRIYSIFQKNMFKML